MITFAESKYKKFDQNCSQCQTIQFSKISMKIKTFKHMINSILQSFEKWVTSLINILSKISNDNKWIITAINYATNWSIVNVIKNVKIEIIVKFLHEKIFQHYETFKRILSDNETNFLKNIIKHYLRVFAIKHRNTILYHLKTNEIIENLNETLNNILIKYLTNKATKLWDEFLF